MKFRQMPKGAPIYKKTLPALISAAGREFCCTIVWSIVIFSYSFHKFDLLTDAAGKCSYIEFFVIIFQYFLLRKKNHSSCEPARGPEKA